MSITIIDASHLLYYSTVVPCTQADRAQGLCMNNKAIKAYPRAHMHRDSDLRVGMSAAPGYSRHMSKKTTIARCPPSQDT